METLTFKLSGEWITDYVRELFWVCHRPYENAEEILLSCLVNDEVSIEERKDIAQDIIEGKSKLVGVNEFYVVEDGSNVRRIRDALVKSDKDLKSISNKVDKLQKRSQELVDELEEQSIRAKEKELECQLNKVKDAMGNSNMLFPMDIGLRQITQHDIQMYADRYDLLYRNVSWGNNSWIQFYKISGELCSPDYLRSIGALNQTFESDTESNDMESIVEDDKEDCDFDHYGWLAPDGKYTRARFGDHEKVALEILDEKDWYQDYCQEENMSATCDCGLYLANDYLVNKKGYVLLHNPYGYGNTLISAPKRLTKAQKEFLYDYFMHEGNTGMANSLYKDEQ